MMEHLRVLERSLAALAALSLLVVAAALAIIAVVVLSQNDDGRCLGFNLRPVPCAQVLGPGVPGTR